MKKAKTLVTLAALAVGLGVGFGAALAPATAEAGSQGYGYCDPVQCDVKCGGPGLGVCSNGRCLCI